MREGSGRTSPRRPRIQEVASLVGLSAITVSRALRQPEKVAPETRARVMEAVEALGYIPNLAASSLASNRSGIIALVVPTIAGSIFADTVQGLYDALAGHSTTLSLIVVGLSIVLLGIYVASAPQFERWLGLGADEATAG